MSTNVFIVDDHYMVIEGIRSLLQNEKDIELMGHAMTAASCLAFLNTHLPDVILMDINLPGISGLDALKILSLDPTTAHIPILAVSANAIPRDIEKGLQAGFFRYLTKPINVNEFMRTLDETLSTIAKKSLR